MPGSWSFRQQKGSSYQRSSTTQVAQRSHVWSAEQQGSGGSISGPGSRARTDRITAGARLSLSDRAAWVRCQLRRGPNTERMSGSAGSDDAVPPNTVRSLLSCMSLVKPGMVSRPSPPGTPVSGSGWICA